MKIALLVRGFHFLRKDRFGFPLDGRRYIGSLQHRLINALRRDHEVDLFLATYDSPILGGIQRSLSPRAVTLPPVQSSTQVSTYLEGLNLIQAQQAGYDRILVTRFDLRYLKPVEEWNIWGAKGIFLPWREYEDAWQATHKVGDAIHVIDAPYLEAFKKGLGLLPRKNELHQLYDALTPLTPDVHFLEPEYYDSNTLYWNKECRNPIYQIANRPRLPISQPFNLATSVGSLTWGEKLHWKFATALLRPMAWVAQWRSSLPAEKEVSNPVS